MSIFYEFVEKDDSNFVLRLGGSITAKDVTSIAKYIDTHNVNVDTVHLLYGEVQDRAFTDNRMKIKTLYIDDIDSIGVSAFEDCSIEKIDFGRNVISRVNIQEFAFANNPIKSLTIRQSRVKSIRKFAFAGLFQLESLEFINDDYDYISDIEIYRSAFSGARNLDFKAPEAYSNMPEIFGVKKQDNKSVTVIKEKEN